MNNTKTIFKSLLIMIVAISLFTVSCSKDEGGTKTPTNPITPKDSATLLTDILIELGPLNGTGGEANVTMVDFSKMTKPQNGSASIDGANRSLAKVKPALDPLKKANFINEKIELTEDAKFPTSDPKGSASLDITLTFKAKAGYEFDESITGTDKKAYTYDKSKATATLILKISPEGGTWQ